MSDHTTVDQRLPTRSPASSAAPTPRDTLGTADNGVMHTVLVVEDEREIRELLRRYLTRAGLSVVVAATGADALLKLEEVRPDLVLLDLGLPDIDGSRSWSAPRGRSR